MQGRKDVGSIHMQWNVVAAHGGHCGQGYPDEMDWRSSESKVRTL